ncbi:bifunctional riboflavin kinase/FAD synthetase [Erysipelothrix inopinata]|uniref:Riboflavin biosynthesis protein n=1 Tax=Erysipelothrix inopinata TaxID=225084 RepID=A0A7G9RXM0_9FIRM|nr:bifunctional riboflavin kinase/FAD synthetase [Erysipelothrix inopinata]QNN60345.1 bifunctional riboflavin kinase/FAD synthetase [Erysipelothrix inopinata]
MKETRIKDRLQLVEKRDELVACIGYFDGLHKGHQLLINEVKDVAKERGLKSAIITFDPDPWTVVNNKSHVNHLTPMRDKIALAESMGIDHLIIIEFTKDISKLEPIEFVETILVPLNVRVLVCGEDFRFGYRGAGNVAFLQEHARYYFDTHIMEIDYSVNKKIGTTAIVQSLLKGDIESANDMLGREYHLSGFVVKGHQRGREIGFPTANIEITDEYVIPQEGVYAGYATVRGKTYRSLISIGHNPTFNHSVKLSVESHLLDFDEDIYGEVISQTFVSCLREQIKFDSIDALIVQMNEDKEKAVKLFDEIESAI